GGGGGPAFDPAGQQDGGWGEAPDPLVEQQHAMPAGALQGEARELGPVMRGHWPAAVGGPVECVVVDHDELAVARRMDVELDLLDGQLGSVLESDAAVLGPQKRAAAMRGDIGHLSVGSRRSRSQSPTMLTDRVESTITTAGHSMIQGARVMYSRP